MLFLLLRAGWRVDRPKVVRGGYALFHAGSGTKEGQILPAAFLGQVTRVDEYHAQEVREPERAEERWWVIS